MDVDEALSHLGKRGRWQMTGFLLTGFSSYAIFAWHMLSVVYTGWTPPHYCNTGSAPNTSIPLEEPGGSLQRSQCLQFKPQPGVTNVTFYTNQTESCSDGWVFNYETDRQKTLATEFNLVCDKAFLVQTSQSLYVLGNALGGFLSTSLSDTLGRKRTHLGTLWLNCVVGSIIAIVPDYTTFVVLRVLSGILETISCTAGVVWMVEFFQHSERTFAGACVQFFWVFGSLTLGLFGYLIHDWRHLQLTVSLLGFVTISYVWILPESVPWLAANGHEEDAKKILRQAAKTNGIKEKFLFEQEEEMVSLNGNGRHANSTDVKIKKSPRKIDRFKNIFYLKREIHSEEFNYGIKDLFTHPLIRRNTVIIAYQWLQACAIYYALVLGVSELGGDRHINYIISITVELPAYLTCIFILERWGRRLPLVAYNLMAAISLGALIFIPAKTAGGTDLTPLIITITQIGKFADSSMFAELQLYVMEVVPTNLRNSSNGVAFGTGAVGTMMGPFLVLLGRYIGWLPNLIFAVFGFSSALLALLLPETLNRPLPQTVAEMEQWDREDKENQKTKKHFWDKCLSSKSNSNSAEKV